MVIAIMWMLGIELGPLGEQPVLGVAELQVFTCIEFLLLLLLKSLELSHKLVFVVLCSLD